MSDERTPARLAQQFLDSPWLTGGAIWSIAAASGALNAWGWWTTSSGLVAGLLVTLALAAEILGVRLAFAVDRAAREPGPRFFLALPLFLGVVAFNAYSGHRALVAVDAAQRAPAEASAAEHAGLQRDLDAIDAAIAAAPRVPENVHFRRAQAYAAARAEELARLDARRDRVQRRLAALRDVRPAPAPLDDGVVWAIVALVEGLKAFGLFAVSRRAVTPQRAPAPTPARPAPAPTGAPSPNAGRDLAMRRWHPA